jgi:4-alpha-glucanotransferase
MQFPRSSGVILHPTSLPGRFGIGDLGVEAYRFVDWLAAGGQKIWQVLPLGPTGYGDSPYQCFSAFAGNPLLIDLDPLVNQGLLEPEDIERAVPFPEDQVDYGRVIEFKLPLLRKASRAFHARASGARREDFDDFITRHAGWLDDFALYMAVKEEHGGLAWTRWDRGIARREPAAIEAWRGRLRAEVEAQKFQQFVFFEQWEALRKYCYDHNVRIMGDLPIYVAHDSSDVWAAPELFLLDEDGNAEYVAGVPPDYFSATGQLWGNPIYRWDVMARRGYGWWMERFQAALGLVDMLRVDHFRGFEAYWQVPAGESTAVKGEWVKGPGAELFEVVETALGNLPIVAENLGVITPEVEEIRKRFGYPGMSILQFAFGNDPQGPDFRPHNYPRERVAYTGTHDNDTTVGWWNSTAASDSVRTAEDIRKEREFARKYLATDGAEISWVFIRTVLASVADIALYPMQDVLGLGTEARMNLPGRPNGNWRWRCRRNALSPEFAARLGELTALYGR